MLHPQPQSLKCVASGMAHMDDMHNQLIYSRILVKVEGERLRSEISELWSSGNTIDLELALVINTVTHGILNPCEQVFALM